MKLKVIGSVLWIAVLVALWLTWAARKPTQKEGESAEAQSTDTVAPEEFSKATVSVPAPPMTLPDFRLTNTRGETITRDDLIGKPAVYSFVFSRCITTCRPITMEMKKLHDKFADADVQFVTITVDPEYDTVEGFGKFADIYDPDFDRWEFLTGSKEAIYGMIRDGFHLQVEEMFGADVKPGMEVAHTNRVVLINPEGIPVKTFLILNDGDRAKLTRILEGKADFPQPEDPNRVTLQRGDGESTELTSGSGE